MARSPRRLHAGPVEGGSSRPEGGPGADEVVWPVFSLTLIDRSEEGGKRSYRYRGWSLRRIPSCSTSSSISRTSSPPRRRRTSDRNTLENGCLRPRRRVPRHGAQYPPAQAERTAACFRRSCPAAGGVTSPSRMGGSVTVDTSHGGGTAEVKDSETRRSDSRPGRAVRVTQR